MDFTVSADHRVKFIESKNFSTLLENRKKCRYERVIFVTGALGTVTQGTGGLGKERVETTQTTAFWNRLEYWEESWRLEETCYHSVSSERPSANTDVKNSQGIIIIIIQSLWKYS